MNGSDAVNKGRPVFGAGLLLGAAFLWGFGFYAQRVSINMLPPLTATALRLLLTLPIVIIALLWRAKRAPLPWMAGLTLGSLLYAVFALQAVAMLYTPVSRVALIAGLYVVMTPLLQPLFALGNPTPLQILAACVACIATVLLCGVLGDPTALWTPANVGDALMIAMALVSAICVLLIARFAAHHDPVGLGAVQILVMTLWSFVIAPIFETAPPLSSLPSDTWWSLLYLALCSTLAAFLLQLLGQRELSPSSSTIILMLETPIGVIAAVALLGESMAGLQWLGAALALLAVACAIAGERAPGRR